MALLQPRRTRSSAHPPLGGVVDCFRSYAGRPHPPFRRRRSSLRACLSSERGEQLINALYNLEPKLAKSGVFILRYSLVMIFLGFGLFKFTAYEAAAIAPLTENSPFFSWINAALGQRGGSNLIGTIEIITAILIALRQPFPRLSAMGSLMAAFALVGTLSFLVTTPGLDPKSTDAGFLMKDIVLLGAALWTAAEALSAARTRDTASGRPLAAATRLPGAETSH